MDELHRPALTGRFVAFEGVDGCGKSTQVALLAARLSREGRPNLVVREPGGTPLGEEVRRILLHRQELPLHLDTETLLFLASRVQLFEEKVRPALASGVVVLSDRYHLSTLVYQGWARGADAARLRTLLQCVLGDRKPTLHVVIDVPIEQCLSRLGAQPDRFERDPEFLARVSEGFTQVVGLPGDRIARVSGIGEPSAVAERVYAEVCRAL
ncbi:MAG: dTMP kinase [Planctomycetota bacterium]